jgi:hypothetical protein
LAKPNSRIEPATRAIWSSLCVRTLRAQGISGRDGPVLDPEPLPGEQVLRSRHIVFLMPLAEGNACQAVYRWRHVAVDLLEAFSP